MDEYFKNLTPKICNTMELENDIDLDQNCEME